MKLKNKRQSDNVNDRRNQPLRATVESFVNGMTELIKHPGRNAAVKIPPFSNPVQDIKVSKSMEKAAKEDKEHIKNRKLLESKEKLDKTVNAKADNSTNRIRIVEVGRPDPEHKHKLKFEKEIGERGFERATRRIQVTPGKWNIHEN